MITACPPGLRAAGRQTVPAALKVSDGQLAEVPVQLSALSQGPATGRHDVPAALKPSVGQVSALLLHVSAASHRPFA